MQRVLSFVRKAQEEPFVLIRDCWRIAPMSGVAGS